MAPVKDAAAVTHTVVYLCATCRRPVRLTRFGTYGHLAHLSRGHHIRPVAAR